VVLALGLGLAAGLLVGASRTPPARGADADDKVSGPRYSVIDTEGHNLIVTDNKSNILYFYTIDKDKEIGSDLKLRGSLDLNDVGKPVLKPKTNKGG
jgi:hypothetical protein